MSEHVPSLTIKTMFWIERFQKNGGFNGDFPHWNRVIGHADQMTVAEDIARMRADNPEQKFRGIKVSEEIVFP